MKPAPILAFLALGLAMLSAGCASATRPDSINVSVADLKAANSTVFETQLIVTLRYTSESLNAFGFSGSSHKLYLNGSYVGKAVSNTPIGLPPLSTTTQDVTLILENASLVRQLISLQSEPVVRYKLESVLYTTAGEDEMKIKGTTEGTIDLRGLQGARSGN